MLRSKSVVINPIFLFVYFFKLKHSSILFQNLMLVNIQKIISTLIKYRCMFNFLNHFSIQKALQKRYKQLTESYGKIFNTNKNAVF